LPRLLVHVLEHRLRGSLVLRAPAVPGRSPRGEDAIVFEGGAPVRVRTAHLVAPLGEMLVRLGVIADVDLDAALARAQRANARLGRQLVSEQLLDKRVLLRALREQILVRMRALAALPEATTYEFHRDADLLEEGLSTNAATCDPLAGILAVVRAWPDRAAIDRAVEGLGERPLRFHPRAVLERFELDPQEQSLVRRIRERAPTAETLLRFMLAPERTARGLLFVFALTRQFDLDDGRLPLGAEVEEPSLRDSALGRGLDPMRTSAAIQSLGAADDHREALALLAAGDHEAAEVLAQRALERDPRAAHQALAGYLVAQRGGRANRRQGLALLDASIAQDPTDDRALVFRATVLRDAGRFEDALRDYREAVARNPGNAEARVALRRADADREGGGRAKLEWLILIALLVATGVLLGVYLLLRR
jgi:tetratricopeptide (TPR) repeat protein